MVLNIRWNEEGEGNIYGTFRGTELSSKSEVIFIKLGGVKVQNNIYQGETGRSTK